MKFGAFLVQHRGPSLAAAARAAEDLGYESAWMGEHIGFPGELKSIYPYRRSGRPPIPMDAPIVDPITAFAFLAGLTSKIKFATGVFVVPLRNPFALAKQIATLDQLSNGRFMFGIGIGWLKEEFEWVGMPWENRALRNKEYLQLMTALWSQKDPVYKGKAVRTEGFKFEPKTVQQPHPPFIFGGNTEAAMKRAARLGEGWYGVCHSIEEAAVLIKQLREIEKRYQRGNPLEISVVIGAVTIDSVKRLADLGVGRIVGAVLKAGEVPRDYIHGLHLFHDQVMSKF
jgi:probable F420-dependent oxidoreductase